MGAYEMSRVWGRDPVVKDPVSLLGKEARQLLVGVPGALGGKTCTVSLWPANGAQQSSLLMAGPGDRAQVGQGHVKPGIFKRVLKCFQPVLNYLSNMSLYTCDLAHLYIFSSLKFSQ